MADKVLTVKILSPEASVFDGEADAVFLPGSYSPFEVLPGHDRMVSTLDSGDITVVVHGGEPTGIRIRTGVVKIEDNVVTACVEQ